VVFLAACKADVRVDIALREDGSGTVRVRVVLDADAARRLSQFAPLSDAVPLADLEAAGWDVSEWESTPDGGAAVTLAHDFVGGEELDDVLAELAPAGTFADARIERTRGWFRSGDDLAVEVDLQNLASGVTSDAALAANLQAVGVDVTALDSQLTQQLRDALTVEVVLHAPDGTARSVMVRPGEAERASVHASSFDRQRVVALGVAVALALAAVLLLVAARRSAKRSRARQLTRAT
jgi:hypothetical protein